MPLRPLLCAGLLLGLSGCVAYAPAPLDPARLAEPRSDAVLPADRLALLGLALDRSPAVAAARASLTAAEAGARAARKLPAMTLTLTAEYSKEADAQRPWLYGGSLGVPVDTGGRRTARVTSADLAVVKARYAIGDAVWTTRQSLMQALSDRAGARARITALQALIDQRARYAALIDRRAAAGEDSRIPAVQARLDTATLRNDLMAADAKRAQAEAELARLLAVPAARIAALPDIEASDTVPDAATLDGMAGRALYVRADVLNAVVDYDSAENDLRAAIAGQYPDINLAPGYTWERGVKKWPLVGTLTLPQLDGNRANIDQARAAREAAGHTLEDQVRTTLAAVTQASDTYASDTALAAKARSEDVPLAENLAARTERMTRAGETDATDRLTADIALAQARLSAGDAVQTQADDRLKLEDALHQAFDPAETAILVAATAADKEVHK